MSELDARAPKKQETLRAIHHQHAQVVFAARRHVDKPALVYDDFGGPKLNPPDSPKTGLWYSALSRQSAANSATR